MYRKSSRIERNNRDRGNSNGIDCVKQLCSATFMSTESPNKLPIKYGEVQRTRRDNITCERVTRCGAKESGVRGSRRGSRFKGRKTIPPAWRRAWVRSWWRSTAVGSARSCSPWTVSRSPRPAARSRYRDTGPRVRPARSRGPGPRFPTKTPRSDLPATAVCCNWSFSTSPAKRRENQNLVIVVVVVVRQTHEIDFLAEIPTGRGLRNLYLTRLRPMWFVRDGTVVIAQIVCRRFSTTYFRQQIDL